MPKKILGGMEIEVDEDGFIQEPEKWNKEIAEICRAHQLRKAIQPEYHRGMKQVHRDHAFDRTGSLE